MRLRPVSGEFAGMVFVPAIGPLSDYWIDQHRGRESRLQGVCRSPAATSPISRSHGPSWTGNVGVQGAIRQARTHIRSAASAGSRLTRTAGSIGKPLADD